LPNTFTYGETKEEAFNNAIEVLELMVEEMIKNDYEFSMPSKKQEGEIDIPIAPYLTFSLLLRTYRKENKLTQDDMAKILRVSQQQAAKLEKPSPARQLGTITNVLSKIGMAVGFSEIKKD
jgi:DNA-binding XRE family transcriptional regulator